MKKLIGFVLVVMFSLLLVSSSVQAAGKASVGNTLGNAWASVCAKIHKIVDVVLCSQEADENRGESSKVIHMSVDSGDDDAWSNGNKQPVPDPDGDDDVWSNKRP